MKKKKEKEKEKEREVPGKKEREMPGKKVKAGAKPPIRANTVRSILTSRRRQRAVLLRLNDEEVAKLGELACFHDLSRSNVLRMVLKQAHAETVVAPFQKQAKQEVAEAETALVKEAERRAENDRVDDLRRRLLHKVRVREKKNEEREGG